MYVDKVIAKIIRLTFWRTLYMLCYAHSLAENLKWHSWNGRTLRFY